MHYIHITYKIFVYEIKNKIDIIKFNKIDFCEIDDIGFPIVWDVIILRNFILLQAIPDLIF